MKAARLGLLVLSITILALLVVYADPVKLAVIIRGSRFECVVLGLVISVIAIMLRAVRWYILLQQVGLRKLLPVQLLGITISNFTPGKVGEPTKTVILKLRSGIDISASLPSIVWERIADVIVLVVLSAVALVSLRLQGTLLYLSLAGAIIFTAIAVIALLMLNEKLGRRMFRFARGFPVLSRISEDFIKTFYQSHFSRRRLLGSSVVTILAWMLDGVVVWLALSAIGISLSPLVVPGIFAISAIIGIASLLPGGIGGTEVMMSVILGAIGIEPTLAITGSILARFMTFWLNQFLGGISLVYLSRSIEVADAIKSITK